MDEPPRPAPPTKLARWVATHRRGLIVLCGALVLLDAVALVLTTVFGDANPWPMALILIVGPFILAQFIRGISQAVDTYDTRMNQ